MKNAELWLRPNLPFRTEWVVLVKQIQQDALKHAAQVARNEEKRLESDYQISLAILRDAGIWVDNLD
jgi:hypothetical protein